MIDQISVDLVIALALLLLILFTPQIAFLRMSLTAVKKIPRLCMVACDFTVVTH